MIHNTDSKDSIAIKSGFTFIFSSISVSIIGLIVVPIYLFYLSPEQYGIYTLFISSISIVTALMSLAGDAIIARLFFYSEKGISRGDMLGSLGSVILFNSFIVFVLLLVFQETVIDLLERSGLSELTKLNKSLFLVSFFIIWIKSYERVLKASQDIHLNPILKLGRVIIQVVASLIMLILLSYREFSLIYGFVLSSVIIGSISLIFYLSEYKLAIKKKPVTIIYKYTMPLIPNRIAAFGVHPLLNFMVASLLGIKSVGIFGVAYLVMNVVVMVFQKVLEALTPWLYQNFFIEKPELLRVKSAVRATSLVNSLITLGCLILAPAFLGYFFPQYFSEAEDYLRVIMIFPYVNYVKSLALVFLLKTPQGGKYISYGTYVFLLLIFSLGYFLIPHYGLLGACWTLVISRYLSSEITIYFANRDQSMKIVGDFKFARKLTLILILLVILPNIFTIISIVYGDLIFYALSFLVFMSISVYFRSNLKMAFSQISSSIFKWNSG